MPIQSFDDEELLASLSHVFRGPLSTIYNSAEAIRGEGQILSNSRIQDNAQQIQAQTQRMLNVVDDLIELFRIEAVPLRRAPFILSHTVEEAFSQVQQAAAEAQCTLVANIPADLPRVDMDATALAEAIEMLLRHTLRFAKPGIVGASVYQDEAAVIIAVHPGKHQERPQESDAVALPADHLYGAFGVGLLIAKRITERHGGVFWATSADDSSFSLNISLPV